jgi:proline iminopeptidase
MAVGDGHLLHVEECGAPDGLPVVFLHDGPGIGCRPEHRELFDPLRFRTILIDQRGAGFSLPAGECEANTTPDLVADIEYVREALGIPAWVVFGNGWGSLLALAYAELFPERVVGLVLCGVFLGSTGEIDGRVHAWQRWLDERGIDFELFFRSTAPGAKFSGGALDGQSSSEAADLNSSAGQPHGDSLQVARLAGQGGQFLAALADDILAANDLRARCTAHDWLSHATPPDDIADTPEGRLADARLQLHYLRRHCFVTAEGLIAGVGHFRHLPGAIVQGLDDPVYTPQAAEHLHHAWPEAIWMPVPGAGHDLHSPAIARAAGKALDWVVEGLG